MNQTERFFKIEQLIAARKLVSFNTLLEELEVSRATLKRDLEYLRSRMKAPITYDREANGYRFGGKGGRSNQAFPIVAHSPLTDLMLEAISDPPAERTRIPVSSWISQSLFLIAKLSRPREIPGAWKK